MYVYCISALNGPMVLIRPLKKSRAVKMNTNRWKYYSLSCLGGCSGRSRWRALKWRQSRPRLICHVLIWMLHLSGKFVACSKPFEWRQSLTRSAPAPHTSKRPILASRLWGFDGHFWRLLLCQLGQVMKQRVTFEWLVFIRPASAGPITQSAALCSSPPSGDDEGINYWKGETGCSIPPPPLHLKGGASTWLMIKAGQLSALQTFHLGGVGGVDGGTSPISPDFCGCSALGRSGWLFMPGSRSSSGSISWMGRGGGGGEVRLVLSPAPPFHLQMSSNQRRPTESR